MAVTMRSKAFTTSGVRAQAPRAHTLVVRAEKGNSQQAQIAAATLFTAAALFSAAPANAGVVIAQPQLKKTGFYDESAQPLTREARKLKNAAANAAGSVSAPSLSAPSLPKLPSFQSSEGGLDPRVVALPGAVGAIAGLAFLATKVDPEISDWFDTAIVKNNNDDGVGYEPAIKPEAGVAIDLRAGAKKTVKKVANKATAAKKIVTKAAGTGSTIFKLPFSKDN